MTLTTKRRVFIEEYLKCFNATEAARRATYAHPNVQGPTLVNLSEIKEIIDARLKELAMEADEVLLRLSEQARGDHSTYIKSDGTVDLPRLIEDDKAHLIKGTRWDRSDNLIIEFYDAQSALVHIGKAHGLFTDVHKHIGSRDEPIVFDVSGIDLKEDI